MKNTFLYVIGLVMLFLTSCDAENSISTKYACKFVFYTQYHAGTSIETALNNVGNYVFVSAKQVKGAWHIYATLNDGKNNTEDIALTTAKENYVSYSNLGANNGFILGLTNFSGAVAWDRQCPNCIAQYSGVDYPLQWTGNRQSVKCSKCGRTYSLETGGITEGNKGDMLMRYQVSYAGIGSILSVGN